MEIDLLAKYPRTKRDLKARGTTKTEKVRKVARKFGREFFDGDRKFGYGGFNYDPRFWPEVVKDIVNHYRLDQTSKVLDIGCAKGFMLYDLSQHLPLENLRGIDVSEYAISNAMSEVKDIVEVGDARDLSKFDNNEFDLIISVNTIHNLKQNECGTALQKIERVGQNKFITVDAWTTEEEKKAMMAWNLTAKTRMHVDDWKQFFNTVGYTGDYYWFMP